MPDVDLTDPNLDPAIQQEFQNREHARAKTRVAQPVVPVQPFEAEQNDRTLTSMIDSIGQLDIDDKGGCDYHGTSSGAVFLRRMKEHFRGLLGPVGKMPFLPRPERPAGLMSLDSPSSAGNSPFSAVSNIPELPPKDVARKLCYYSLSCATCLVRIVHVPTFYDQLEKLYERRRDNLSKSDAHFLALLYSVMALGCMYNNLDESDAERMAHREAMEEG